MFGMISLHGIAASRGDGLRPEILELLVARQVEASQPNVANLEAHRDNGWQQSGPHPLGHLDGANLANVVQIAPSETVRGGKARRAR
jgi:hypothetical protein